MNASTPNTQIHLPAGVSLPAIPSLRGTREAPGRCGVCGRWLPDQRGKSGRTRLYCKGETCTGIAKRINEVNSLILRLVDELDASSADSTEARSYASAIKSFLWSEMNGAINALGPLKKKAASL